MPDITSTINNEEFRNFVRLFASPLIYYAEYGLSEKSSKHLFNTVFLGRTHSVSSRLEEILDYYNAKCSVKWKPFRENVAAVKLFTNVAYITLHLKSTSPRYKLLSGIDTFLKDTDNALEIFNSAIQNCFSSFAEICRAENLVKNEDYVKNIPFSIIFPEGKLESDIEKKHVDSPETVIVNMATTYLNIASESELLDKMEEKDSKTTDYNQLIPIIISENIIRSLETKYHNLQSLYDTYILDTSTEDLDKDLKLIRGHVSIVYHLLEASTHLIHYYERHMMGEAGINPDLEKAPITSNDLLGTLVDYYLNYANQFLRSGVNLCHDIIKKYAEEGLIIVKVPAYRGFHVRPSTLVSKIVQHYGSEVSLIIDSEEYDASHPMELFCVNEKINADKRRNLAHDICELKTVKNSEYINNFEKGLKEVFYELLKEKKIINYSHEFSFPDFKPVVEETLGEFANRAIAFLLAQGKIDLKTDLTVTFKGDKRVLADIQLLAECGYGEDNYGNNIVLPKELSYLRRK